ncbi:hypothetical protein KQI84_05165 [bacterium]|nr:hypothetical protein [bacterium]
MTTALWADGPELVRVEFETEYSTNFGQSIFVVGSLPELGKNDPANAVKMSPYDFPKWKLAIDLPAGTRFTYRYIMCRDTPEYMARPNALIRELSGPLKMKVPGNRAPKRTAHVRFYSDAEAPQLEYYFPISGWIPIWTEKTEDGLWESVLEDLPGRGEWKFRLRESEGQYMSPKFTDDEFFITGLMDLWVRDGQIFAYEPPADVSPSRVVKIDRFPGTETIPDRPVYVYTPRGYDNFPDRKYPVIYMHDGQNLFEAYAKDSFIGSWHADDVADRLIGEGRMRECLIVGVGNNGGQRVWEYLPPYGSWGGREDAPPEDQKPGRADKMAAFYRDRVAPYIEENYRALSDPEDRATCGSSMGGIFSAYIAWEFPEFARNNAAMSSAFDISGKNAEDECSRIVERFRTGKRQDMRLWIDSGTKSGRSDDGMGAAFEARDALLENGYAIGPNLQQCVDVDAIHSEQFWAERLDKVFLFLFPVDPATRIWASNGRLVAEE